MMNTTQITADVATSLPRFKFIAVFMVANTRRAEQRKLTQGWQVRYARGTWSVVQTEVAGGVVEYKTSDAALLFDYVRRGPLGYLVRKADEFRTLAYEYTARREAA